MFVRLYDQIESYLAKAKRIQIILKTDFKGKFVYIQLLKCAIPLLSIRTKHVQLGFSKVSDSILATGGIVWGRERIFWGRGEIVWRWGEFACVISTYKRYFGAPHQ